MRRLNLIRKNFKSNREKKANNRGALTIEALISFTGFLFVMFTILNVANYCRVQMLISNAMDTTAKELAQYSYFYEISGLQKFNKEISAIGDEGATNLNTIADSVGSLYSAMAGAAESGEADVTGLENSLKSGTFQPIDVDTALKNASASINSIQSSINHMDAMFNDVYNNPVMYMKSIIAVAGSEGLEL